MKNKLFLIILGLFLSGNVFAGSILVCEGEHTASGSHVIAVGKDKIENCRQLEDGNLGPTYEVEFINFGPGLKVSGDQWLQIGCSADNPSGTYAVVGGSCSMIAGCTLRLAMGSSGLCEIHGLQYGIGGDLSVGIMKVRLK